MMKIWDNFVIGRFQRYFIVWWYIIKKFNKPSCWPRQLDIWANDSCCFVGFSYRDDFKGETKLKIVWNNDDFYSDEIRGFLKYMTRTWK